MNYEDLYCRLMESRSLQKNTKKGIFEKHHIVPLCLGGKNNPDNLVWLTFREHFIAHRLLIKFLTGKNKCKMGYAFHRMCRPNNRHQLYRRLNSKEYEKIKRVAHEAISGENAAFMLKQEALIPCMGKHHGIKV